MSDVDGCVDCSQIRASQNCYQSVDVVSCNNCQYIRDCQDCSYSSYMFNCTGCSSCFACVNMQNQQYCIFNTQYTKEEYAIKLESIQVGWYNNTDFSEYIQTFPQRHLKIIGSENVSGNMIYNSHNVRESFEVYDAENIYYSTNIFRWAHDCMDGNVCLNNSSRLYEMSLANKSCSDLLFCHDCWNNCRNLIYCTECKLSQDCFGCTGLVWKQYCILNKQYTKEVYQQTVAQIITSMKQTWEWWEFFPLSISPFGYNESVAQQHYPLQEDQAIEMQASWSHYEAPAPKASKTIAAHKLPIDIQDIPNDVLNWAIECEISKKPFRIIQQELLFYRTNNLPIPKRHPNQRYLDRMRLRNPRQLYERNCHSCEASVQTTYSPEKPEKVYCETCYNTKIY